MSMKKRMILLLIGIILLLFGSCKEYDPGEEITPPNEDDYQSTCVIDESNIDECYLE